MHWQRKDLVATEKFVQEGVLNIMGKGEKNAALVPMVNETQVIW